MNPGDSSEWWLKEIKYGFRYGQNGINGMCDPPSRLSLCKKGNSSIDGIHTNKTKKKTRKKEKKYKAKYTPYNDEYHATIIMSLRCEFRQKNQHQQQRKKMDWRKQLNDGGLIHFCWWTENQSSPYLFDSNIHSVRECVCARHWNSLSLRSLYAFFSLNSFVVWLCLVVSFIVSLPFRQNIFHPNIWLWIMVG